MSELKTNLEQILQEKTTKLIPENIKRKVEIFDVVGTDGDAEVEELQAKIIETRQEIADTRQDLENSAATVTGTGENVTLNQTAEATLKKLGVGGNSEQVSYEGYNIINISNQVNRTDSGVEITADVEKQIIKFNGTIDNTYCTSAKLALSEPLSTGVFRANFNSKCDAFIVFRSSDDTWLKSIQSSNNSAVDISTLSKPVTHIQFGIEHLTSGTNVNYEVGYQLTEGSELKSYEPYTGGIPSPNPDYPQEITNVTGDVEVVVENKNLAKINSTIKTAGGTDLSQYNVSYTVDEDGTITLNGTANNGNVFVLGDLDLKPDTYMFEYIYVSGSVSSYVPTTIRDGSNNALKELSGNTVNDNKSLVNSVDGKSLTIYVSNGKVFTNFKFKIQIEKSSIVTDYVEHEEQKFIFPLGNEKLMLGDYLADDGIHHVRKQIVLDGSENINWKINSFATHYNFYAQVVSNCKARQLITCSHSSSNSFDDTLNNCYISAAKNFNFNFSIDGVTTSNAFNNWLSTHNTVVEYELQDEVIVPYTEAQQQVYNEMKKAISYEEQTNVSSSDTISPIFTVTAFKDADLVITSLDNQLTLKE